MDILYNYSFNNPEMEASIKMLGHRPLNKGNGAHFQIDLRYGDGTPPNIYKAVVAPSFTAHVEALSWRF